MCGLLMLGIMVLGTDSLRRSRSRGSTLLLFKVWVMNSWPKWMLQLNVKWGVHCLPVLIIQWLPWASVEKLWSLRAVQLDAAVSVLSPIQEFCPHFITLVPEAAGFLEGYQGNRKVKLYLEERSSMQKRLWVLLGPVSPSFPNFH